jgi:predicted transglutaminase-like cysteine proteinase
MLSPADESEFYEEWESRFVENSSKYITPKDSEVLEAVRLTRSKANSGHKTDEVLEAWKHVYKVVQYDLSKEWKTPRQTLIEGIGDCEDVTFVISSMLSAMGLRSHKIHVGSVIFNNGKEEYHTWNSVGGRVIDATSSPNIDAGATYHSVKEIEVKTDG